jgi:hypothetical protein
LHKEDLILTQQAHDQKLSPSNTFRVINNHKTRLDEAKFIRPASKTGTAPSLDEDHILKLIGD